MLKKEGVKVLSERRFTDHHCYTKDEVAAIVAMNVPVITTEKDWVKIRPLLQKHTPGALEQWYVARVVFDPLSKKGRRALCTTLKIFLGK